LSTNRKIILTLVVLFSLILAAECSKKEEKASSSANLGTTDSKFSAEAFVGIYSELAKIDRKYSKVFDSFLKQNNLEESGYRLVVDSTFIMEHPELVSEYKKLTDRYEAEKREVFSRSGIGITEYGNMLKNLSNGTNSALADSISRLLVGIGLDSGN